MADHTVKAYDEELNHLSADVARMGGLAEAEVADALDTVTHRDLTLVQTVIERDLKLDALDSEIEKRTIRLIALRQPVAQDLRYTVAAIAGELWNVVPSPQVKCSAVGGVVTLNIAKCPLPSATVALAGGSVTVELASGAPIAGLAATGLVPRSPVGATALTR